MEKPAAEGQTKDQKLKQAIRMQEVGVALMVSTPFAVLLMGFLNILTSLNWLVVVVALVGTGFICLQIGDDPDCPKQ
jgi:hypothetical protein